MSSLATQISKTSALNLWGYLPILFVSFYELKKGTLLLKDSLIFFILRVYLLSFSLVSIFLLRSHDNGLFLIFVVFSTIWLSDSFAYLGGRLMGKTPLSVHSPNKTWEGSIIGGLVAFFCILTSLYFFKTIPSLRCGLSFICYCYFTNRRSSSILNETSV